MNTPHIVAGRFQIDTLIGRGGMGEVFRGIDRQTGEAVAVKLLRPDNLNQAPSAVERFRREGEALGRLNHPNIVKMLATVEEDGHHYIVMEYVSGGSLRDLLDTQPLLPLEQVLNIALDLADALTRAHRLNIIHRDLKPANVLLASDGTPRLTDFGISQMGDRPRITQSGVVVGTDAYLSPEACRGAELDTRTDIWSFGAMLFEMLTGRRPFDELQTVAMLFAILTKPIPDLLALRPDLPIPLVNLIYSMLEKDRTLRIPSVRRVGSEIESIQRRLPTKSLNGVSRFQTPTQPEPSLHPNNLPTQPTPFIGRREELDEIRILLQSGDCRLLTLVGLGGSGKTRLGIQAATEQLERFVHGVYFVPLASLNSPDLIAPTIAEALQLPIANQENLRQQLADYLREKRILLLLDNFEHIIAGADLLGDLLNAAPNLKILVTSRERLNLQQEWVFILQGMAYPDNPNVENFEEYPAIQMFLQSMHRAQAGLTLSESDKPHVLRICQLVEGMPLGIELAAAWVRTLSPHEIAQEIGRNAEFLATFMRNQPQRHRSMRAVFEYSWHLLSEPERDTLRRLSVFRGGFWRDTAAQVAQATLPQLSALLDKSLLRRDTLGRYEIHELLRQFAASHLAADHTPELETRDRHCAYYAEFLNQRAILLRGGRSQREASEEIREEIENIRAAWKWAVNREKITELGQMLDSLARFYDMRSWFQEGCATFGQAVAQLRGNDAAQRLFARLSVRQGEMCYHLGNYAQAQHIIETGLHILHTLNDPDEMAHALLNLGTLNYLMGNHIRATQSLQESLSLYRALNDQWGVAHTQSILGLAANTRGEYAAAQNYLQESLNLYKELDDRWGVARLLNMLGVVLQKTGDYDQARHLGQESLALSRTIGDLRGIAYALGNLGVVSGAQGEFHEARTLLQESLKIRREIGDLRGVVFSLTDLGDIICQEDNVDIAEPHYLDALRCAVEIQAQALALWVLVRIARVRLRQGEAAQAAELVGLILNHPRTNRETYELTRRLSTALEQAIAPAALRAAQERGKGQPLDQVVEKIAKRAV